MICKYGPDYLSKIVVVVVSWFVVTEAVVLSDKQRRFLTGGGLYRLAAVRRVQVGHRGTSTQVEGRSLRGNIIRYLL